MGVCVGLLSHHAPLDAVEAPPKGVEVLVPLLVVGALARIVFFYLCDSGTFPGPRADFWPKSGQPAPSRVVGFLSQKPPREAPRAGIRKIEKIAPSRIHFGNTVFFYLCDSGTFPGPRADFRSKNSFPAYWPYTMDRKFAFLDPWGPQNGQKFDLDKNFAFQDHVGSDSGGLSDLQRIAQAANQNS